MHIDVHTPKRSNSASRYTHISIHPHAHTQKSSEISNSYYVFFWQSFYLIQQAYIGLGVILLSPSLSAKQQTSGNFGRQAGESRGIPETK
jgi:hypothetical protein